MQKTRIARRRPSLATAISLVALVIAMSGSAYAATGGTFILGKANKATSVTSLSNSNGTALALNSTHGKPPLTVSSSVQVPKLDASELGGVPAAGFLQGHVASGTLNESSPQVPIQIPGGAVTVDYTCEQDGLATFPLASFTLTANMSGVRVWYLNKDGSQFSALNATNVIGLASSTSAPYTVVVQIVWGPGAANMATAVLSLAVDDNANTCGYAAQVISAA